MRGRKSRRNLLTIALLGLCAVLAVLAFVPPPAPVPEKNVRPQAAAPLDGAEVKDVAGRPPAADGPAFRRPIFLPSRRLPGGGVETVNGLKLRAVFLGPGTKKALVETAAGEEPVWVTTGQELAGWQVEEIDTESVVLMGRNGRRTLKLEKPDADLRAGPVRTSQKPR